MSAPITESHLRLANQLVASPPSPLVMATLIADSEARAVAQWSDGLDQSLPDLYEAAKAERDQLRAALALGQKNCDEAYDDLRAERDAARAEVERLTEQQVADAESANETIDYLKARAERAEAEVQRLKSDGAASAFINMSCRASRAETDRNNLRADLDAIKAILNEEKARAERAEAEVDELKESILVQRIFSDYRQLAESAEAELAAERARLDAVVANCWAVHSEGGSSFWVFNNVCGEYIATAQTYRAAIDAAMKEGAK